MEVVKMEDVLNQLDVQVRLLNYAKRQMIYRGGAPTKGFFFVKSGLVGLYQTSETGKESLLRIYGPGYSFGYRSLVTRQSYRSTARSMTPSELIHVDIDMTQGVEHLPHKLLSLLMRGACYELGEAEMRITQLTSNSAKVRIVDAIIYLFDNHPEYQWTYREVGEFSGTDTTTVIRFCSQLKQEGLLQPQSRKINIVNMNDLLKYRNELT
ncbi:hypothetical protein M445_18280 [Vibrio owensii 47666-1]|uniref:Crp/Fnr family transcriptional regulator n=1 Tax=Vibrio owensii TaxID=696485 RepID=UPI00058576F6|nr:Crp/Fnr family transcriptional regulator [Vibrio owensii]KIF46284.1 hypothetical protein M445_18280 [Vibrio owensii 47666-1]